MKRVTWIDDAGRRWLVGLPDYAPDGDGRMGVPLGPPSLAGLGLPEAVEVRMHNALFDRGLLTEADAKRRPNELVAAVMSAYRVDAHAILAAFAEPGRHNEESSRT